MWRGWAKQADYVDGSGADSQPAHDSQHTCPEAALVCVCERERERERASEREREVVRERGRESKAVGNAGTVPTPSGCLWHQAGSTFLQGNLANLRCVDAARASRLPSFALVVELGDASLPLPGDLRSADLKLRASESLCASGSSSPVSRKLFSPRVWMYTWHAREEVVS